jgi:hypothetical protein
MDTKVCISLQLNNATGTVSLYVKEFDYLIYRSKLKAVQIYAVRWLPRSSH